MKAEITTSINKSTIKQFKKQKLLNIMKRNFILTALIFCSAVIGFVAAKAAPVDAEMARMMAQKALKKQVGNDQLVLAQFSQRARARYSPSSTTAPFYIFNVGEGEGFVVIAGDDRAPAVLGYADEGQFSFDDMPESMVAWLDMNAAYMERISQGGASVTKTYAPGTPVVKPLLGDIVWGQDDPYNQKCPTYTENGETKHYYVGCVATAATQIMYYHKWPNQGTGSKSYTMNGQTLSADFGSTTYEWNKMVDDYRNTTTTQEQDDAVATIASHFGIAVEMSYEKDGSGASSVYVPIALRDYFGYTDKVVVVRRDYVSSEEWMNIIKRELDLRRPVYYGGTSENGLSGHAFVCDGYDDAGYVHINWGWYGKANGYFLVNHLDPDYLGEGGGTGGFNRSQEVVIGIQPAHSTTELQLFPRIYGITRLSCASFGTDFMLMTFIENYDNAPFVGQYAAVIAKNGEILKVLKEEELTIDGIKDFKTGYTSVTMRYIPVDATGIADGDYEIRLAVKGTGISDWMLLRHSNGLSDHATATVENGKLKNIEQVYFHPDVKLLTQLNPLGEVFAKGAAKFKVTLENRSNNFDLQNVVIRMTSADDSEKQYETSHYVNVYNGATETLTIVVPLDETMEEGKYFVTMHEKNQEAYPFDDSEVGVGEFTLLPEKTEPYLRLNVAPLWSTIEGEVNEVEQGELVNILVSALNYGATGEATAIARLINIDNPDEKFIFRQNSTEVEKGKNATLAFSRRIPVDPGTYKVEIAYLDSEGNERIDTDFDDNPTIIKVVKNEDNELLRIVDFEFPTQIKEKTQIVGKLKLASDEGFNGKVYVRVRPYTLLQGELAWMGTANITAGNEASVEFKYTPSLPKGKYLIMIEGKVGNNDCAVGGYKNGYRLVEIIGEETGINDYQTPEFNQQTQIYDLQGRRLSQKPKQGIYIENGKKKVAK